MGKCSDFFVMVLDTTVLRYLRILLRVSPLSVRRLVAKTTLGPPLWLTRHILNIVTKPIGDESKWIHKIEQNTWKGMWIIPDLSSVEQAEDAALNSDLVVLYAHGGGYCKGNSTMYMETFMLIINHLQIKHSLRASILSLEYSLSPENAWPKARDEAMEAYRYLTDTVGISSSKIVFAGDSAGGNLAAVTLLTIKSQKRCSQPAGAALISPWVDLTIKQPSFAMNSNDFLNLDQIESFVEYYLPNYKNLNEASRLSMMQNPLISPLYGDFSSTCPILLAYGEKEFLRSSIENFKLNLEKDGVSVTTLKGKNALHVWLVCSLVASTQEAFEKDCKIFIDWMASIITGSSNVAK